MSRNHINQLSPEVYQIEPSTAFKVLIGTSWGISTVTARVTVLKLVNFANLTVLHN